MGLYDGWKGIWGRRARMRMTGLLLGRGGERIVGRPGYMQSITIFSFVLDRGEWIKAGQWRDSFCLAGFWYGS